jgi:dethiobiotin synthetase
MPFLFIWVVVGVKRTLHFSKVKNRRIIFITGTDTGVGKTLLTGMLLHHLRQQGIHALAMKPFCSGGTSDVDFIQQIQGDELSSKEVNPFYFSAPVAPYVAQRGKRQIPLSEVMTKIKATSQKCEVLLVEGSGGLLVPLAKKYFVADLIAKLRCEVVLVARNKLGTINHTLLSLEALQDRKPVEKLKIVLMGLEENDLSAKSNVAVLREFAVGLPVFSLPFLGRKAQKISNLQKNCKKNKKTLAKIAGRTYFPRLSERGNGKGGKER